MKNCAPLRNHRDRQQHLYLVNYSAHAGRRWLLRWVDKWRNNIPEEALAELDKAIHIIKILDDLEKP